MSEVVQHSDGAEAALAGAIERVLGSTDMRGRAALQPARLRSTNPAGTVANLLKSLAAGSVRPKYFGKPKESILD